MFRHDRNAVIAGLARFGRFGIGVGGDHEPHLFGDGWPDFKPHALQLGLPVGSPLTHRSGEHDFVAHVQTKILRQRWIETGRIVGTDCRCAADHALQIVFDVTAAGQPFPSFEGREFRPVLPCLFGGIQSASPATPFRIGVHKSAKQQRRGVRVTQGTVRVLVVDAEFTATIGKTADTDQGSRQFHGAQHGMRVHRNIGTQPPIFRQ